MNNAACKPQFKFMNQVNELLGIMAYTVYNTNECFAMSMLSCLVAPLAVTGSYSEKELVPRASQEIITPEWAGWIVQSVLILFKDYGLEKRPKISLLFGTV